MMLTEILIQGILGPYKLGLERYHSIKLLRQPVPGCGSLIFEAVDSLSRRPVVLKVLHPERDDPYWQQAFAREESLLKELVDHPNVVKLIEGRKVFRVNHGVHGKDAAPFELQFLTVERGELDLMTYIRRPEREPLEAMDIFRQLCRTVSDLHQCGIFHRDLKPSNCVLTREGSPKLIDFAAAWKSGDPRLALSESPNLHYAGPIGDRRYSPPEMFCGMGRNVEMFPYADVFALGAILYELWTGSVLTEKLYDDQLLSSLTEIFYWVADEEKRFKNYSKIVGVLKQKWKMPSLLRASNGKWKESAVHIEELFVRMTALDYSERCSDFSWIIEQIDKAIDKGRKSQAT